MDTTYANLQPHVHESENSLDGVNMCSKKPYHCIFRYHEIFFMIDTCQAESMFQRFYSPNILSVASSHVGEDSLSVRIFKIFFLIENVYILLK